MQNKNILIISTSKENGRSLSCFFEELAKKNRLSYLYSLENISLMASLSKDEPAIRLKYFGGTINTFSKRIYFFILFPFFFITNFFLVLTLNKKHRVSLMICLESNEKLIFTPIAWLLGIKMTWIEFPETATQKFSGLRGFTFKLLARYSNLVIFTALTENRLVKQKVRPKKFILLRPALKTSQYHQDTIFEKLAYNDTRDFRKKFFTIGAILDLDVRQKLEYLFQAIKTCLTVISNIQLVVVGDGKERKELIWLTKKMQIDNLVWFVGKQEFIKKWLASFDVYVIATENPNLNDLNIVLAAQTNSLPVIGPQKSGFEDIIIENKTGVLIDMDNTEMLARQIIKLYQDPDLRKNMGSKAKEIADKNFTAEIMAETFIKKIDDSEELYLINQPNNL